MSVCACGETSAARFDFALACCLARHGLTMRTLADRRAMLARLEASDPGFAEQVRAELVRQFEARGG